MFALCYTDICLSLLKESGEREEKKKTSEQDAGYPPLTDTEEEEEEGEKVLYSPLP